MNVETPRWYTSILYVFGFFLFLEWLYPVKQITDTAQMYIFFIYTAFCFGITLIRLPFIISFTLKGIGAFLIMHHLFFEGPFLSITWFIQLVEEVFYHITLIFNQDWSYFTPLFRSFLFLLLIWLMSHFIYYWFVHLKHLFLFIILTFVYVGVLDTFTPYDAGFAMVRIFAFSLFALGMSHLAKELKREQINFSNACNSKWMWIFPLFLFITFSAVIGYFAPKWEASWDDPVPYLKEVTGFNGKDKVIKKVGLGEDDTRLGGSFEEDYTPVFQAIAKEEQYWRVETKDVYTGKGWKKTATPEDELVDGKVRFSTFDKMYVEARPLEVEIEMEEDTNIPKLIYPYGVKEVVPDEAGVHFFEDGSDAIRVEKENEKEGINKYQLKYDHPSYPYELLQDDTRLKEFAESAPLDSGFISQNTQLPDNIPSRVRELATEITTEYESYYDKIKAVEQYFNQNGFIYQTSNIPVPDEEQDYVDQFLFDTKKGYCDNYSTSMVVMLRSLGIPSRWVKGFTGGEKVDTVTKDDEIYSVFQVTNMNAHSWVEVYFPKIGWIPFEPTQGFSNLADFHAAEYLEETDDLLETPEQTEIDEQLKEKEEFVPEQKEESSEENKKDPIRKKNKYLFSIPILMVMIIGFVMYYKRLTIHTKYIEKKWENNQDVKTFQELYHHLLKLLKQTGKEKENQQTLREYAKQVDLWYDTDAMEQLTTLYEQVLYRNEQVIHHPEKITQLSKKLINHIMG